LREKTGKNTDFLILLKKTDFLVAHFVTSWRPTQHAAQLVGGPEHAAPRSLRAQHI
jgi:hypothetical protein